MGVVPILVTDIEREVRSLVGGYAKGHCRGTAGSDGGHKFHGRVRVNTRSLRGNHDIIYIPVAGVIRVSVTFCSASGANEVGCEVIAPVRVFGLIWIITG